MVTWLNTLRSHAFTRTMVQSLSLEIAVHTGTDKFYESKVTQNLQLLPNLSLNVVIIRMLLGKLGLEGVEIV